MIIDITELLTVKRTGFNWIVNWLINHVGPYIGPGIGLESKSKTERKDNLSLVRVIEIGQGWQIEAHEFVDSYGRTIYYKLDIDDEKMATFFILKFL